jgi:hypothetical protein
MSIYELTILIIAGLIAGTASGALGIGGGIVVVPTLVFLLGLSQHSAQGTSLAFMLPPIGLLAAINYYKSGYVNIKYAIVLVLAFFIGSYLGSVISINLPDKILKKAFGILMLFAGIKMITGK